MPDLANHGAGKPPFNPEMHEHGMKPPITLKFSFSLRHLLAVTTLALAGGSVEIQAANVTLTASDANGANTSFNSAGYWSNSQAPAAGNDYFTAGYLLRTPNTTSGSNTFGGNSLRLDYSAASPLVGLAMKYTTSGSVLVNNLKLNGGGIFNGVGATMSVYGNITVLTNSYLDPQAAGRTLAIYAPISGGATNLLGIRAAAGSAGGIVQLLGNNNGYNGNWYVWGIGDSAPGAVLQVGNGGTSGNLGTGNVINNASLVFDRADNFTVGNAISGPGTLTQAGTGTVTLTGTNTFTGSTTVNAGSLALGVTGTIASTPSISLAAGTSLNVAAVAGFSLAPGQNLAGYGSVVGSINSVSGAVISPGGTLTINGNLTLGNNTLNFNLNTPNTAGGANSLLLVNGNLTLNPGITVNAIFPGGTPVPGTYTLCQCTGTLAGAPANLISSLGSSVVFAINTASSPAVVTMTIAGTNAVFATNSFQIVKVYLEGGQSNADGRAVTNGLPVNLLQPQASVPFYYYLVGGAANGDGTLGTLATLRPGCSALGGGTTFGPELTFGNTLANYYAVSNGVPTNNVLVALIKYAHGGTSLAVNWAAPGTSATNGDGPDYLVFQQVVRAGLTRLATVYPGASIELDGMIWVQGETDIDNGTATAYGTNLIRLIKDVRLKFATNRPYGAKLPFIYSRISAQQTFYSLPTDASYANYLSLRASQSYTAGVLANSNVFMLDIDGSQFSTITPYSSPGLHFDTAGQQALGKAFAEAVRNALPAPELSAVTASNNGVNLTIAGVAGTKHVLERAASPAGPWTLLATGVLNSLGVTNYIDQNGSGTAGFYRASRP